MPAGVDQTCHASRLVGSNQDMTALILILSGGAREGCVGAAAYVEASRTVVTRFPRVYYDTNIASDYFRQLQSRCVLSMKIIVWLHGLRRLFCGVLVGDGGNGNY